MTPDENFEQRVRTAVVRIVDAIGEVQNLRTEAAFRSALPQEIITVLTEAAVLDTLPNTLWDALFAIYTP